ncbi:MAG: adenylate kinase [Candidatus Marinimicrobia bacterium]|nr:adenylate kinase [Candidatus Neomarinimicrobiota bacterium]
MKIILLGPPGVGKGTQAQKICRDYNAVQISTGDMLRNEIKGGTELGKKADEIIKAGKLVSDDIILGMIENKLFVKDKPVNYILDGFPRTIPQALGLDEMYAKYGEKLDLVLLLEAPENLIIDRLAARRSCKVCNQVYHLVNMPPKVPGLCDKCGGELFQREDDKPETIKNRLKVYTEQTEPLASYYREKGLLRTVDSTDSPEDVHARIKKIL